MRGTRTGRVGPGAGHRFIPACAGNTSQLGYTTVLGVHPRVCGEHVHPDDGGGPACRFIPACAGNTSAPACPTCSPAVHPRVCGEHGGVGDGRPAENGSSPRVRGTRARRRRISASPRFIPACAGNTQQAQRDKLDAARFIPACAGNTRPSIGLAARTTVHPRVCGEHQAYSGAGDTAIGSSPRVRGTRCGFALAASWSWFIPACAGNTLPADPRVSDTSVHPRVCGEHAVDCWRAGLVAVHPRVCGEHPTGGLTDRRIHGSSPRVRGTRVTYPFGIAPSRFIPACAGNTTLWRSPQTR